MIILLWLPVVLQQAWIHPFNNAVLHLFITSKFPSALTSMTFPPIISGGQSYHRNLSSFDNWGNRLREARGLLKAAHWTIWNGVQVFGLRICVERPPSFYQKLILRGIFQANLGRLLMSPQVRLTIVWEYLCFLSQAPISSYLRVFSNLRRPNTVDPFFTGESVTTKGKLIESHLSEK